MENKFDLRVMSLGNYYKFYGRCYYIDSLGFEIEVDVSIKHTATIDEAMINLQNFKNKNTVVEETILPNSSTEEIS